MRIAHIAPLTLVHLGLTLVLCRELRALVQSRRIDGPKYRCDADCLVSPEVVLIPVDAEPDRVRDGFVGFSQTYAESSVVVIENETYRTRDKASKINTALRHMRPTRAAIYDADSSPTKAINSCTKCDVAQQSAIYKLSDRESEIGSYSHNFWSGVAANQTMWSLCYERSAIRSGSCYYLVGHGLMISSKTTQEFEFRESCPGEDIELGYRLSAKGVKPCLAVGFDMCEAVSSLGEFVRQNERWFAAEVSAVGVLRNARTVAGYVTLTRRLFGLAFWLSGPYAISLLVLCSIRSSALSRHITVCCVIARVFATMSALRKVTEETGFKYRISPLWLCGFMAKPILGALAGIRFLIRITLRGCATPVALPGARRT